MQIVVETPRWSFIKIEKTVKGFKKAFYSPIPTPFNYGFIEDTRGMDGMPMDVIILGKRLDTGTRLDAGLIGRVRFLDDGIRDDKYIATLDKKNHELAIRLFFTFYSIAKVLLGFYLHRRWTNNRFEGIEWFKST